MTEEHCLGDWMEWSAESLRTFRKENEQSIGLRGGGSHSDF